MHRLAIFFFLTIALSVSAQVSPRTAYVRCRVVYTPLDYFASVSCVVNHSKFQRDGYFGFGINRTIFQGRLFPEIGGQFAYLTSDKLFRVLPYGQFSVSRLRITDASAHYWLNPELGVRLEFHQKRNFGLQVGYRNMLEFWRHDKKGFNTSSFGLSAGIYFEL